MILIEVSEGCVVDVYSTKPIDYIILDRDVIYNEPEYVYSMETTEAEVVNKEYIEELIKEANEENQ